MPHHGEPHLHLVGIALFIFFLQGFNHPERIFIHNVATVDNLLSFLHDTHGQGHTGKHVVER